MRFRLALLFASIALCHTTYSQEHLVGKWEGALELPGLQLEMSIKLALKDGLWSGLLDIPIQNVKDMKLADLEVTDTSVSFSLPDVPGDASYAGRYTEEDVITGTFMQAGQQLELVFLRADNLKAQEILKAVQELAPVIDSFLVKYHVPGLAISVVKDDEIIMNAGFGYADIEQSRSVTANTLFAIGSASKAFTAAGLAILDDRDEIDWEKPVAQYLPDFKMYDGFASAEMTALDLTTHRSGLPRHDLLWYGTDFTREELFDRLQYLEPTESFRSAWQYQNLMYMTAGVLIERITGTSWEDFTSEHIFQPLGMNRSNFSVEKLKRDNDAAIGYRVDENDQFVRMDYRNIDEIGPAGSINSTSTDMAQWLLLNLGRGTHAGQEVIGTSQYDVMHAPHMVVRTTPSQPEYTHTSYGTGWFIYDYAGTKVIQHGGNIDGFTGYVYLLPEENTGVAVLVNKNGARLPAVVANMIADIVLQHEDPIDWARRIYGDDDEETDEDEEADEEAGENLGKIEGTSPTHPLQDYVGTYTHAAYAEINVSEGDDGLSVLLNGFDLDMVHYHYNVFEARDSTLGISFKFQFQPDLQGSIQAVSVAVEPMLDPIAFKKSAPDQRTDQHFVGAIVGTYSMENFKITIEQEQGKLFLDPQGQERVELLPFKTNHFKAKDMKGFSIEFIFDGSAVKHALLHQPNGVFKVVKD